MGSSLFCLTGYKFFQTRENLLGSFQKSSLSISYKSIIIVIIQLFCVVFERLGLFTTNKICLSKKYIYLSYPKQKKLINLSCSPHSFSATHDSSGEAVVEGLDVPRAPPSGGAMNCRHFTAARTR